MSCEHNTAVSVSVVVPSFNPGQTILPCIESVCGQSIDVGFEIIVVDSSTDDTMQLLRNYSGIQIIHQNERLFPGAARNLGVEHARGRLIAFVDADCTASPGWLEAVLESHAGGHPVVGGSIANGAPESLVGSAEYFLEFGEFSPARPAGPMRFAPTCNFSIESELFRRTGGFASVRTSEDVLFGLRLQEMGVPVHFEPHALVYHRCRTALGSYLRNQVSLGRGAAIARRKPLLPGSFVVRWPILVPLLPFLRVYRMTRRMVQREPGTLVAFIRAFPAVAAGLGAWSWGFLLEAVKKNVGRFIG